MTKKVLVTERLAEAGLAVLRDKGCEVDVKLKMTPEELIETVPGYDALIVRSATKVTAEVVEAADRLRIIGRAGVGVDNVDVEAATEHGIIVCNAPTSNIVSAAEHAIGLMLACARKVPQANASMHEGVWERGKYTGVELYEKTLAIFGLGRIGGLVAERARAFGMKLIGYDPYCSPERAEQLGVTLYDDVDALVPLADFITVHLPKTKETIGMFGPDQYARMKDGVIPQFLKLTTAGALAHADASILVAGTLKGILSYQSTATVTPVNADAVAKRHGIKVETLSSPDAGGYASTVSVVADGTEVACTLAGEAQAARLVSLFGYQLDIAPAGQSLVFEYVDAPGRVGTIGTILGEAGINITTMQIATLPGEQCALVYMNVEGDVDDDVLSKLRAGLGDLKNLWYVKL